MKRFKSLKDHVYDYIETQIKEGKLSPNQRINEAVICKELNISRTPVREALIQLSAEGVLETNARKGFILKAVNEHEVAELYSVIGVLDGYAAKLSCARLDEQDLSNLAFYIEAMDIAIKAGNYFMYDKHQVIFHQLYIDKCGNSVLIDTIEKTKNKLLKRTYLDDPEGNLKKILLSTNDEHRQILALFRAKDADALAAYLADVHWRPAYAPYDVIL